MRASRSSSASLPLLGAAAAFALAVVLVLGGPGSADGSGLRVYDVTRADATATRIPARAAASWCGTAAQEDRRPNVLSGHPVHWIYALPADGADRFAPFADAMQTDAEAIDVWWRREDPTRTPRNDLAPFPCGSQLDISMVRFPQSGGDLAGGGRFGLMAAGIQAAGFRSSLTKYVVYYDGPVSDDRVCGQGGSDRSGFGLAVVYAQACTGVSTAVVAAHELLHTFGAVSSSAPSECEGEGSAHVCDDARDLMYPFIDTAPLDARLLDVGRNDYYGNGGGTDTRNAPWLIHLDGQVPLALAVTGPGSVAADLPGLECSQSCTTAWNAGTRLALAATPRAGARFVRWGGACGGVVTCTVTLGRSGPVTALFAPATFRLTVRVAGQGSVRSGRAGITCRPRCASAFLSHVPLRITASPARGWRFRSWTGVCRGTRPVCTVAMTRAGQARAVFVRVRR